VSIYKSFLEWYNSNGIIYAKEGYNMLYGILALIFVLLFVVFCGSLDKAKDSFDEYKIYEKKTFKKFVEEMLPNKKRNYLNKLQRKIKEIEVLLEDLKIREEGLSGILANFKMALAGLKAEAKEITKYNLSENLLNDDEIKKFEEESFGNHLKEIDKGIKNTEEDLKNIRHIISITKIKSFQLVSKYHMLQLSKQIEGIDNVSILTPKEIVEIEDLINDVDGLMVKVRSRATSYII